MDNSEKDFVEVPGFEKQDWFDVLVPFVKVDLPTQRIELPIEARMSPGSLDKGWFLLLVLVFNLVILSVVTYQNYQRLAADVWTVSHRDGHFFGSTLASSGRFNEDFYHVEATKGPGIWSTCSAKPNTIWGLSYKSPCHLFIALILGAISTVSLAIVFWNARKRLSRVLKKTGPHLRVDRETFWCEQLAEPIRFADVLDVTKLSYSYRGPRRTTDLIFRLNAPPRLAYGRQITTKTRLGEKPAFRFSASYYPNSEWLVHVIAFLVEQHQKEHSSRVLTSS